MRAETFLRSRLEYSVERERPVPLFGDGSRDFALRKRVGKVDLLFLVCFSAMPLAVSSTCGKFYIKKKKDINATRITIKC